MKNLSADSLRYGHGHEPYEHGCHEPHEHGRNEPHEYGWLWWLWILAGRCGCQWVLKRNRLAPNPLVHRFITAEFRPHFRHTRVARLEVLWYYEDL